MCPMVSNGCSRYWKYLNIDRNISFVQLSRWFCTFDDSTLSNIHFYRIRWCLHMRSDTVCSDSMMNIRYMRVQTDSQLKQKQLSSFCNWNKILISWDKKVMTISLIFLKFILSSKQDKIRLMWIFVNLIIVHHDNLYYLT